MRVCIAASRRGAVPALLPAQLCLLEDAGRYVGRGVGVAEPHHRQPLARQRRLCCTRHLRRRQAHKLAPGYAALEEAGPLENQQGDVVCEKDGVVVRVDSDFLQKGRRRWRQLRQTRREWLQQSAALQRAST